jgi:hypothetical protein
MSNDDEKKPGLDEGRYALDLIRGRVSKGELAVLTQARVGLLREELASLPLWAAMADYLPEAQILALADKIDDWTDVVGYDLVDDPAFIPLAVSEAGITYAYCHPRTRDEGGPTLVMAPGAVLVEYRSTTSRDEEDILCRALPDSDKPATWSALEQLYASRGWTLQQMSAKARFLIHRIAEEIVKVREEVFQRGT